MNYDDDEEIGQFADQDEALAFWRQRAQKLRSTLRDTETTLKEFEESSRELEKEMESELNAVNNKSRELQVRAEKLKGDVDEWKGKYQRALTDHNKMLAEVNRELSTLRESHAAYRKKVQEMELDNDELENAERMVTSSLTDMEVRYNRAIERTALLEEELVAKTKLEEENQRLKDEIRELKEELGVWQDRHASSRPGTRTSIDRATPSGTSSAGRASLDLDRSSYRPSSRTSYDRPSSRLSTLHSPPTNASSSSASARRPLYPQRSSLAASSHARRDSADVGREGGMSSSPSSNGFRPRQSVRSSLTSQYSRTSTTAGNSSGTGRVQQGASMRKMAGLLKNLRELQVTVHTATRIGPYDGQATAIPRPSSRLSTSVGPGSSTPRRSIDLRRSMGAGAGGDDSSFGGGGTPPSSIPLPTNGLSRSTSQRPPSRLQNGGHHIPSSVRSQTPNLEHYTSLDFLDQDPTQSQQQYRRRSQIALSSSTNSSNINALPTPQQHSATSGLTASASQGGGLARPRGSTFSSTVLRRGTEDPLRKSVHPRTGKPAPPPVSLRQTITSRQRSSSFGSNQS